jgi:hypothetical protein
VENSGLASSFEKLVDNGFSPIPILSGTKRPPMNDWSRYCDSPGTAADIDKWVKWPAGGMGVACGYNGLVAVDFDTDDHRIIEAVQSVLPYAVVEKAGRLGFTAFYRASTHVDSRAFNIDGRRVLDVLADGRQTVIPPSLHPATGKEYIWTTPLGLDDVTIEHLELVHDDFVERIEAALKPFGYQQQAPKREYDHDSHDEAHDRAMVDFDAWVPQLGIPVIRSPNGKYRAVATWRGGENYNVSFAPQGIKDWRDDEGFSPRGVVERALGLDSWDADNWLRERLGMAVQSRAEVEAFVRGFLESLRKRKAKAEAPIPLSITAAALLDKDVGEPEFIVEGWLQNRKVGLLLGEDGAGKSFLLLDLAIAVATGSPWLGVPTIRAPVLFLSAEEEDRDIKVRLKTAKRRGLSVMTDNLHIISVNELDERFGGAILASLNEKRELNWTKLWDAIVAEVDRINPKLIILEPLNELFDGDEMVRRQARQFMDKIRKLVRKKNSCAIAGAHPSNTSVNERKPGAGSNGWNATTRMRWWLEVVRKDGDATNERKLHRMKVTGAYNDRMPVDLSVGEGGWLEQADGAHGGETKFGEETRTEESFITFITERDRVGAGVSYGGRGSRDAAKEFVASWAQPGKRPTVKTTRAMIMKLLSTKRIDHVFDGPSSRNTKKLVPISQK